MVSLNFCRFKLSTKDMIWPSCWIVQDFLDFQKFLEYRSHGWDPRWWWFWSASKLAENRGATVFQLTCFFFFFPFGPKASWRKIWFRFRDKWCHLDFSSSHLAEKTNWINWFWAIPTLGNWNLIRWTWSAKAVCIFSNRSPWGLRVNFFGGIGMWQEGAAGDSYLLQVMARGTCDSGIAAQMQ